jgi:hypothetical protein
MSNNNQDPSHDESLSNLPAGGTDVSLGEGQKGKHLLHLYPSFALYSALLSTCFLSTSSHLCLLCPPAFYPPLLISLLYLPIFSLYLPLAASSNIETGLLAPLGDPLGNALNKGLSPVGTAVGGITNGGYTKSKEMDKAAEEQQSMGGKEQSGQNPLGL